MIEESHHRISSLAYYLTSLIFGALLILFGLLGSTAHQVSAATPDEDSLEMTLSPTKQRLDIAPASRYTQTFSLYNTGKERLTVRVYASPYYAKSDKNYTPIFQLDSIRTQINRWISFPQTEFKVSPKQSVTITYTVTTPGSIPDGSQFATLFAETTGSKKGTVISKKRIGMLLFARSNGKAVERGSIAFQPLSYLQITDKITLGTQVENSGNTDFDSTIETTVTPAMGDHPSAFKDHKTVGVLPETTRTVSTTWNTPPFIGLYTISRTATTPGNKHIVSSSTFIIVSPLAAALIALCAISFVGLIIRYVLRYRTKLSFKKKT